MTGVRGSVRWRDRTAGRAEDAVLSLVLVLTAPLLIQLAGMRERTSKTGLPECQRSIIRRRERAGANRLASPSSRRRSAA
jgi:hypothetical protein